jgi:hypothetical protein
MLLASFLMPAWQRSAGAASNTNIQTVNLNDHHFSVEWFSDQSVTGSIQYGTSCGAATTTSPEQLSNGYVHLASAGGAGPLASDTTFYYKVVDNGSVDDNGGQCYTAKTFHQFASPGVPTTVYGFVKSGSGCSAAAYGALTTLTVTHAGTTSLPLAAITSVSGGWNIVVGVAIDASGNFMNPTDGDTINVTAAGSVDSAGTQTAPYHPPPNALQQLPDICLSNAVSTPGGSSPTPTATGVATSVLPTGTAGAGNPTATLIAPANTATPTGQAGSSTGTPTPTSTTPALPVATATALPTPTASPTQTTAATPIALRAHLTRSWVRRGAKQQMIVHTVSGALVSMVVTYPKDGGLFHSTFRAGKDGLWSRTWVVRARYPGRASVLLTVVKGRNTRHFHRAFTVG